MNINHSSKIQEASPFRICYSDDDALDVYDLTGKTPFDDLMEKEERLFSDNIEEYRAAQVEAISGLLSFLFKQTKKGEKPTPRETAMRLWILVYTVKPELIDGMTLAKIGALFDTSGQNISKRLITQNDETNVRARNRKSEDSRATYSQLTTERWKRAKRKKKKSKSGAANKRTKQQPSTERKESSGDE